MKATFGLTRPDAAEATLSLTMTVHEWRRLRASLGGSEHPQWQVAALIDKLIAKATTSFDETGEFDR